MMGLRNLTLVLAPNLLVKDAADATPERKPRATGFTAKFRAGPRGGAAGGKAAARASVNPLEELMNIEMVSNALHMLAAASMRSAA